jgi:ArsR family transcriptional regulator
MTILLEYEQSAEMHKVLANAKRLAIIHTLAKKELSVDALTKKLNFRKTNISQHLAILRHARLVCRRKDATKVYYRLADQRIVGLYDIVRHFLKSHRRRCPQR